MYATLLVVHGIWRWVALLLLVASVVVAVRGRPVGVHRATVIALDIQATLGLLLFGVSPMVRAAWNMGTDALQDPVLRFWSAEHGSTMLAAVVGAHVVHARAKRSARPHRWWGVGFTLVLCVLLAAIPWPGLSYGRSLWPL